MTQKKELAGERNGEIRAGPAAGSDGMTAHTYQVGDDIIHGDGA